MEFFNPLDFDKWRGLIADFDKKRIAFYDNLAALRSVRGATPELEAERQKLIKDAGSIDKNIQRLMNSLEGMRKFFKGFMPGQNLSGLGFAPIALAVGLGAAAAIVYSITQWLTKTAAFAKKNELAKTLASAGATPNEIIEATKGGKIEPSILGLPSGGLKWVALIAGIVIVTPFALKWIEGRR